MTQVYLALYRYKKPVTSAKTLFYRSLDTLTKWLTRGRYSHCELAIKRKDGRYVCYSSSYRDGGVRKKVMRLPTARWDLIPLTVEADTVRRYYAKTLSCGYDRLGALGLVLPLPYSGHQYFCSEWCFDALAAEGCRQGWRFSPNDLAVVAQLYEYLYLTRGKQDV